MAIFSLPISSYRFEGRYRHFCHSFRARFHSKILQEYRYDKVEPIGHQLHSHTNMLTHLHYSRATICPLRVALRSRVVSIRINHPTRLVNKRNERDTRRVVAGKTIWRHKSRSYYLISPTTKSLTADGLLLEHWSPAIFPPILSHFRLIQVRAFSRPENIYRDKAGDEVRDRKSENGGGGAVSRGAQPSSRAWAWFMWSLCMCAVMAAVCTALEVVSACQVTLHVSHGSDRPRLAQTSVARECKSWSRENSDDVRAVHVENELCSLRSHSLWLERKLMWLQVTRISH